MAYSPIYSRFYNWRQIMSAFFRAFWHYRPNRFYIIAALLIQVVIWFFSYRMFVTVGSDLFVAHYNVDFGIDSIGSPAKAFIVPLLALGVLIVNFFALMVVFRKEHFHFLANAFGLASVLTQVLASLAIMSLYLINFLA